jgi:hypothetical protein
MLVFVKQSDGQFDCVSPESHVVGFPQVAGTPEDKMLRLYVEDLETLPEEAVMVMECEPSGVLVDVVIEAFE